MKPRASSTAHTAEPHLAAHTEQRPRLRFTITFHLALLLALALGLRLAVWQWRAAYPLGGDEHEYWQQALTLLQHKQYVELQFMRPPLYTVFLAGSITLFDSVMQHVRLVQAIISALTVVPIYGLTWALFRSRRNAFIAGLLVALNYTLAATATELLTETVFLFGLSMLLWMLVGAHAAASRVHTAHRRTSLVLATCAGAALGALALTRSVALPLLPLGALWLWVQAPEVGPRDREAARPGGRETGRPGMLQRVVLPASFVAAALLVVLPWTARNYAVYHAPILIDTTGPENLWLDNNPSAATAADPLGREAAKRALYTLGDDRPARQRLATQRGLTEIAAYPGWFAAKAWGEATKFFALQYFDELRTKRAIWVPPTEVWCKLLLGDGLWLAILLAGTLGLCCATQATPSGSQTPSATPEPWHADPRWVFVPWVLYIVTTSMLFHVELRYRLPLYPVLVPYAAWALGAFHPSVVWRRVSIARRGLAAGALVAVLALTLRHRFYPAETWLLANKHLALWQTEQALAANDAPQARTSALRALARDDESALARVALARAALLEHERRAADSALDDAIVALAAHPYAHLLRGALLREDGQSAAARSEFAYETGSLEDLQAWAWRAFAPLGPPPVTLPIGDGHDLGAIHGFYPAEQGYRWTTGQAEVQISVPAGATMLELDVASGRPPNMPPPTLIVSSGSAELGRAQLAPGWQTVDMPLASHAAVITVTLRSATFRPRDHDRASDDARALGVMVRRIAAVAR